MKILVTGSTGFIGAALCKALVNQGHSVRAFHRSTSTLKLLEGLPVEHVVGDLTATPSVDEAMQGMDVVFHAAAHLGNRRTQSGRMYAVTVEGTRAVLNAARRAGVQRVVHTSSVAALGMPERPGSTGVMDENHSWNYRADYWPYGYAKHLAEMEVQKAVAQGLDAVIVNPAYVLGAGDIYRQTDSIIVQVARQRIPGSVDGGMNIVSLEDVVDGHLAALQSGRCGQRYILGGHNMTHSTLLQIIAQVCGVNIPQVVWPSGLMRAACGPLTLLESFINMPLAAGMLRQAGYFFYYSTRRARLGLGLGQPRPIEEAVQQAYDWFVASGAIPAPAGKS